MGEVNEELILNGKFLNELIKIAEKCHDNDTDECICSIDTPAGSMHVKMQFSYSIK